MHEDYAAIEVKKNLLINNTQMSWYTLSLWAVINKKGSNIPKKSK